MNTNSDIKSSRYTTFLIMLFHLVKENLTYSLYKKHNLKKKAQNMIIFDEYFNLD